MDKVIITTFTDPMMGLSYECEPIFRKLETHFNDKICFKYAMSVLVRDVYQLVDKKDMRLGNETAIKNYNKKLAKIYEQEEPIANMPINMQNFCLFSTENTSSAPLNIAYKAAQLAAPDKADNFLYNLRYATIVDCRPTTKLEEILKVVEYTDIDKKEFLKFYNNGFAQKTLEHDVDLGSSLGIYSLPSYLIQYGGECLLAKGLLSYKGFVSAISAITDGMIVPDIICKNIDDLRNFINKHPLVSPIEIREAFDFNSVSEVRKFIRPLLNNNEIIIKNVYHGWFIEKTNISIQ